MNKNEDDDDANEWEKRWWMSCSMRKHIDPMTLCFCIIKVTEMTSLFLSFPFLCSSRHLSALALKTNASHALCLRDAHRPCDRIGSDADAKLGYHLLKHLKLCSRENCPAPTLVSFRCGISFVPFDAQTAHHTPRWRQSTTRRVTASQPQSAFCRSIENQVS